MGWLVSSKRCLSAVRPRHRLCLESLEARDLLAAVRFAMIGDFGSAETPADWVADTVKSWDPDFIVTVGDNYYQSPGADDYDRLVGKNWHEYIYAYQGAYGDGSPTPRFFPALGNHDWDVLDDYLGFFTIPGNERYYDFTWENLHFFIVNSNPQEPNGSSVDSVQAAWLRDGLAASTADFQFVLLHHPPYTSGSRYGSDEDVQWPYAAWGADAVFTGHEHLYERLESDGIPFFVVGLGGGSAPYDFGDPIPESKFRYDGFWGAMLVTADGADVTFEFYSARVGNSLPSQLIDRFTISADKAEVVDRHLIYDNSTFDGYDAGASPSDHNALATDKNALRPGETAGRANFSSFAAGINGLAIDVAGLKNPGLLSVDDFAFRVGRSANPAEWNLAPASSQIDVREIGDGIHRLTVNWPDGAIRNTWLQVVLKANATTGLAEDEVHYWGHATADSGDETNSAGEVVVDFLDAWQIANAAASGVPIDNPFDLNRDGNVDDADVQLVLANANGPIGDFNRDGSVGLADLAVLQQNLGAANATATMGDLTRDGQVTLADVAALASAFGSESSDQMRSTRLPLSITFGGLDHEPAPSPEPSAALSGTSMRTALLRSSQQELARIDAPLVDAAISSIAGGQLVRSTPGIDDSRLRARRNRDLPSALDRGSDPDIAAASRRPSNRLNRRVVRDAFRFVTRLDLGDVGHSVD